MCTMYNPNPAQAQPVIVETSYKHGGCVPHGLFRKLDENGDLAILACYVNGHQHGPVWKATVGGNQ